MAEKPRMKETKALAPRRPFADLTRWEREMDRMMDDFFGRRMRPWWPERWLRRDSEITTPALDVYEEKDEVVVKAELPGMDKNDIEVNISDSELTLKGEKKKEEKIEDEDYYRCERSYGAFVRSVDLPADVQPDKVKASFKNGILEIRMPKTEEAKTKEIKIKVE
ncbi:MAG TPA: Hsp20/alpha crystallin family protein [Candidatus Binatia bacterium]|jgi:HSP20 family protein